MDTDEIMENFQAEPHSEFDGGDPEEMDSSCGSGSDVGESNNQGFSCNFDDATAVDSMVEIEKMDLKEITGEEIMRYHFPDREVAFMFYNWYACLHGFAGRRSRNVRNAKGQIVQQTFICHREGFRDDRHSKSNIRKREHKPDTRCGCQAKFQVHIDFNSERWYIKNFDNVHNHSFLDGKYERMLPAHRKMTDHDKYQMKSMRKSGISTSRIYGFMATQAGGYEKLPFSKRDMYNEQFKERGSKMSDADDALEFLRGMCTRDDMMFWKHTLHPDGSLKHLFWCDGVSRMDYSLFGDVLAFDATYKKIKYNTPLVIFFGVNHHNKSVIFAGAIVGDETEESYVWLLENFIQAMDGKCPMSVITDGDLSMRNAIRKVFPDAYHRLCAWHLIRNAQSNVKNIQFVLKFKRCMLGDIDVDEFNRKWEELVLEFGLEGNSWMLEMYQKRKMWATAHIRGRFFAGFRTTSRCEGLHSEFGKYVNVLSNLCDFLQQFFRWLNYLRYKEIEDDYVSSYGETVVQTEHKLLEKSAAKLYTRSVFFMFRPILERSCRCNIVTRVKRPPIFTYTISKYPRQDVLWTVTYCQQSFNFLCSCKRFETLGIACEHIIAVVIHLNIVVMPDCIVLPRWTKCVKDLVNAANASSSSQRDPTFITSYVTLVERCKRMVKAALQCGNPEEIRNTNDMVEKHTERMELVARSNGIDTTMLGSIGNPPRVRRKGGVPASSSQTATGGPKRKTQTCRICGAEGHNRTSCQFREEALLNSQLEELEMLNNVDENYDDDDEDCNIDMDDLE